MNFRRSGQRDGRRRRVLNEVRSGRVETPASHRRKANSSRSKPPERKSENYGDAVFMDEQPRITDLVPTRLLVVALLFLTGIAAIGGLELLYTWMPELAAKTTDGSVASFDLDGEGSLAVWFSSMTMATAGLVAILVFTVRRYRTDDYRGNYRVWLWAAMCWFLISIDETASLHEGFKEMMFHLTGTRLGGDGSIWWVIPYFFLLGAIGMRLIVDMRESWLSTSAMVGAAACYVVAVAAQLQWILPDSGARGVMVEEGAEMLGNLLILFGMVLHARHVILDARGLLPHRAERQTETTVWVEVEEEVDVEEEPEERWPRTVVERVVERQVVQRPVTVHPSHPAPRPGSTVVGKRQAPVSQPKPAWDPAAALIEPGLAAENDSQADKPRKLSKAERKAMRKRLRKSASERQRRKRNG